MKRHHVEEAADGAAPTERDRGAVLILALVTVVLATAIVTPLLRYAASVTHASRLVDQRAQRLEAVKGGLRTALADPTSLFTTCAPFGLNNGKGLASPQLNIGVQTTCYVMGTAFSEDPATRPFGVSAVQVNATLPSVFTSAGRTDLYGGTGTDESSWWTNDTSATRTQNKIWTPNLPGHDSTSHRGAQPIAVPASYGSCQVFFPGTYVDPITLTSAVPTYFVSGVYYFENTVTISGSANVVVGSGAATGCITDQEAIYLPDAPGVADATGNGGTFVFGMGGRLVVNNLTAGTGPSLVFNQRYTDPSDARTASSSMVNIMSVNGSLPGSDLNATLNDFDIDGVLSVPASKVPTTGTSVGPATVDGYRPSTLTPPDPTIIPLPLESSPIVEVTQVTATPVTISVPGYVDVPQGRVLVSVAPGMGTTSTVAFNGGVLARTVEIPGTIPGNFNASVAAVISQIVLRIKSVTTTGTPVLTSDAIVQVNSNGAYAINNWSVG